MDYTRFYEDQLERIKWDAKGNGKARCPFHEDKKPSFSPNRNTGLWYCFGGCGGGTAQDFAARRGVSPPARRERDPEAVHDYRDEQGKLLYQVVRFPGKEFRQRRPDGAGGWIWNLKDVRRVLYRLPEILKAEGWIFVVEGERDVGTLVRVELEATTNSGGAKKWRAEFSESLRGKRVAILGDNDEPGRQHVEQVARALHGVAAALRVPSLAGLPDQGDVTDWFAQGHTEQELRALVEGAPEWSPSISAPARMEGQTLAEEWPGLIPGDMQTLRLPIGYTVRDGRLYEGEDKLLTATPMLPARVLQDVDTRDESFEVLLIGAGPARRITVDAQSIRDARLLLKLTRHGLDVSSGTMSRLIQFISAYLHLNRLERIRQTRRLGWVAWEEGGAYVLHGMHPAGAPIHPLADTEEAQELLKALRPSGDLEGVKAIIRATSPYPIVVTTICASLAPAIREILRLEVKNFWIHLAAESGTGKSLTQEIGLGVWAEPTDSPWLMHGHGSYAGLEKLWQRTFGLPAFVEDAHMISDKDRPNLVYAVGNEKFKARGGERPRAQLAWHGAVISSGELGLMDETSLEGMGARLITLAALPFGKHCPETAKFHKETLMPLIREHHGLLGPFIITRLLESDAKERARLVAWWAGCRDKFADAAAGHKILVRQAPIWALLDLAAHVLTQTLSLQLTPSLGEQVWEAFTEALRQPPSDPVGSAREYVLSYAESNRFFFYVRTAEGTTNPREASTASAPAGIGETETAPHLGRSIYGVINERLGYVAFFPNVLRDVLARAKLGGAERFLRAWRDRRWLMCRGDDLMHTVKIAGQVKRVYALKLPEAQELTPDVG